MATSTEFFIDQKRKQTADRLAFEKMIAAARNEDRVGIAAVKPCSDKIDLIVFSVLCAVLWVTVVIQLV